MAIADKTALKIMHEMGISCGIRRESDYHRYNSFKGVVGRAFDNVLDRDFSADEPWQKLGTGVTEFKAPWGRAYFAPAYDFRQQGDRVLEHIAVCEHGAAKGDAGRPAGEDAGGREPGHALRHGMAVPARRLLQDARGGGHRPEHVEKGQLHRQRRDRAGLRPYQDESSSRGQSFESFEEFKERLEAYIVHWNTRRRQVKLKGLTPEEFRNQSLAA